jgi:16S rRNA (guanine527-N7)-methyltransferase
MIEEILKNAKTYLELDLTAGQTEKFKLYAQELLLWNKKVNLTAIKNENDVAVKHFLDSLLPLKIFPVSTQSIIDIGAGAGFPGIPIKIARPNTSLILVESVGKKVEFLNHIIKALGLSDSLAVWGRAEDVAKESRETFDIAISRAVAPLNVLCELCLPFVRLGGVMIALKSEDVKDELGACENAIKVLGGRLKEVCKVQLPTTDIIRSIVVIDKISATPESFPRRAGMAKKRPL